MKQVLSSQGLLIGQHETTLRQVMEHLQQLTTSVTRLGGQLGDIRDQLTSPAAPADPPLPPLAANPPVNTTPQAREPYIPIPARYSGDLGTCAQFLHQCSLVFSQQPTTYASHQSKIAFVMSLLSGEAAAWSLAISNQNAELVTNYNLFSEEMKRVFDHPVKGREALSRLLDIRQGNQSVSSYAVKFRILAAESG